MPVRRPHRTGVDHYPLDRHALQDRKIVGGGAPDRTQIGFLDDLALEQRDGVLAGAFGDDGHGSCPSSVTADAGCLQRCAAARSTSKIGLRWSDSCRLSPEQTAHWVRSTRALSARKPN